METSIFIHSAGNNPVPETHIRWSRVYFPKGIVADPCICTTTIQNTSINSYICFGLEVFFGGGAKFHHSTPKHNYITIYINAGVQVIRDSYLMRWVLDPPVWLTPRKMVILGKSWNCHNIILERDLSSHFSWVPQAFLPLLWMHRLLFNNHFFYVFLI